MMSNRMGKPAAVYKASQVTGRPTSTKSSSTSGTVDCFELRSSGKDPAQPCRLHVLRFAPIPGREKNPPDVRDSNEFTRPLHLLRKDVWQKRQDALALANESSEQIAAAAAAAAAVAEANKKKKKKRELTTAGLAPMAGAHWKRKNLFKKRTRRVFIPKTSREERDRQQKDTLEWILEDGKEKQEEKTSFEGIPVQKHDPLTEKSKYAILTLTVLSLLTAT